jgi:Niemann-Pick C1 protein
LKQALREVCGPAWAIPDTVCCTANQVETLRSSLQQAEPILSSCPACRNNFRSYHCTFTCSPDQSLFLDVVSTQKTDSGDEAVKEVDYYVSEKVKNGFYDSCKSVQFGATNGFAMDLIGGGAKTPDAFLQYMGAYRPGLGSPFQISIPKTSSGSDREFPSGISPLTYRPLNCSDNGLDSRCTCVDCPEVCASLPYVEPPRAPNDPRCTVGSVSCLTFSLLIIYAVLILAGLSAYSWKLSLRHRQKRYERVAMTDPPLTSPTQASGANPFSHHISSAREEYSNDLGGLDGDDRQHTPGNGEVQSTAPSGSSRFRLGRGASLLDPIDQLQPRRSKINLVLRGFFYRLGWTCASSPALTFGVAALCIAILNIGWRYFQVETNPVRLWVSPSSEAASQKAYFDEHFGPFYRAEQIFVMGVPPGSSLEDNDDIVTSRTLPPATNVLSYDTLDWWLSHEAAIAELRSEPNGYTLQDVCFAPAGPGSPCVVQSVSAWLGTDMSQWDAEGEKGWATRVRDCASSPAECLPDFGQPIDPKLVLGGAQGEWLNAKSLVITYVVANSLDEDKVEKAAEWERTLQKYLADLQANSRKQANVQIAYSTEVSLEAELNKVSRLCIVRKGRWKANRFLRISCV